VIAPNQTYTISAAPVGSSDSDSRRTALHGSGFSFRVYDGDESKGARGPLYDSVSAIATPGSYGTSSHTLLTPVSPSTTDDRRFPPECVQSGSWLGLVHD